ncbi:MAG: hypothetical protein GY822_29490 [Deltaproteobacteria bacterium]|nr:hypothetical protein [Deltaproteobacteria bacterium]
MTSNEERSETIRDDASFLLESFAVARSEVKKLLQEMAPFVEEELPFGTSILDTFLGPAQDACERDNDLVELVQNELAGEPTAESVELATGMLRSLYDGFLQVVTDLEQSVQPFLNGEDESSSSIPGRGQDFLSLALDLQTQRAMLESQRRATSEVETRARQICGRNAYERAADLLGKEVLQNCWMQLVRGEARVEELVESESMSKAQGLAWRALALLTAARIDTDHLEDATEGRREKAREEEAEPDLKFCLKFRGPDPIARGEIGEYVLLVRNDHLEALHLDSIDLERSFSNGFRLHSIEPEPDVRRETDREVTFEVDIDVAAGQAVAVVFRVEARIPGNWCGELTVWTGRFASSTCVPNVDIIDVQ